MKADSNLSGKALTVDNAQKLVKQLGTDIEHLNLSRNRLDHEFAIGVLPSSLVQLDLSFNALKTCSGLERLTNLQMLDIKYNDLQSLRRIFFCTSLVHLNVRGNRIDSVEGLERMTKLQTLDIAENLIER